MAKKPSNLNDMFKEMYADRVKHLIPVKLGLEFGITFRGESSTLEDWMSEDCITPEDIEEYPLAKEAHRIKNTKLYKSLK